MTEGLMQVWVPDATEASIRACALKAIEQGGGTIMLPAGTIQLTQPLPVGSGIQYIGQIAPSWVELTASLSTGTILVGDGVVGVSPGTFNCFEWNTADNASVPYANAADMFAAGIRGLTINNVVLRSFKYGVKFGALNNVGVHTLALDRVVTEHCDIGFWLENCMQPCIGYVASSVPKTGGFAIGGSMGTGAGGGLWHFGNGIVEHVYHQGGGGMSTRNTWGCDVFARGLSSEYNNLSIFNFQANGLANPQPVLVQASAAIFTSGSNNVAITGNIGLYKIDCVVGFGSSVGGIDPNVLYWVIGVTDNGDGTGSIRIGDRRRAAAAITLSASGSSTLSNYSIPLMMIAAHGEGGGSNAVTFSRFPLIDCEGASGLGLALQQLRGCHVESSIITGGTNAVHLAAFSASDQSNSVAMRYPLNRLYVESLNWQFSGYMPASWYSGGTALRRTQGLLIDAAAATSRLFLSGDRRQLENMVGGDGDIYTGTPSGFAAIAFGRPTQKFHGRLANGATITFRSGGFITYSGAGGGSLTLPIITATMVGVELEISNPSTGTLTVNTQSSQLINGIAATTSLVMLANTVAKFVAATADGTTLFWAAR